MADKLGFSADFYNSLTDDLINVSLTEREIYLLGNLLPMVEWQTRWDGDTSGLDLSAIRGNLELTLLEEIEGGTTMSCEDIADCVETSEALQEALAAQTTDTLQNGGYSPVFETDTSEAPIPTLTSGAKAENLLPDNLASDCESNPQIAMGLARAIVTELHQSAEDFFELIEYATNAAEGLAMASEQVPIFGKAIAGALEFMDWVLDTMSETYLAAYNQSVEDELACMIFCHIMDTCSLSIDDLISLYEDKGSITIPPVDDLEAVLTFAIETPFSPDTVCVAVFHYQVLRFMSWGSLGGFSAVYLKSLLKNNVSASDYSYEDLCDDCVEPDAPTTYWRLHYDFRQLGQQGTNIVIVNGGGNDGVFNNGYATNPAVTNQLLAACFGNPDLGAAYVIKAQATRSVRRGSDSNGTNDFANLQLFTSANYAGSSGNMNHNFISFNSNKVEVGLIQPAQATAFRSWRMITRVNENASTGNGALRTYEMVIWGLAGAGDTKPPRSVWAGNTLPTTTAELFPDYVAP